MTTGAGGALNVVFKTILDEGDEVLVPAPYFVEYDFYIDNHGGVLKRVATTPDFDLDVAAIEAAITPKTRAVLINSPNNPTGRVYSEASLHALGKAARARVGRERAHHLPDRRRALPQDRLRRSAGAVGVRRLSAHAGHHQLLQGPLALGRAHRVRGRRSGDPRGRAADGRADPGQPHPGLRQRACADAAGGRPAAGRPGRPGAVPAQPRRALPRRWSTPATACRRPRVPSTCSRSRPSPTTSSSCANCRSSWCWWCPGTGFHGPGHFRISYCVAPQTVDGALPIFAELGKKYFG